SELFHYHREYVFLAPSPEGAVVVPFDFQAAQSGGEIEREVRAWLARGEVWDRFLEESTLITGAAGVWRVVPQGDLRIRVRDPGEVETLRYDSGDRQLRVDLHAPLTQW